MYFEIDLIYTIILVVIFLLHNISSNHLKFLKMSVGIYIFSTFYTQLYISLAFPYGGWPTMLEIFYSAILGSGAIAIASRGMIYLEDVPDFELDDWIKKLGKENPFFFTFAIVTSGVVIFLQYYVVIRAISGSLLHTSAFILSYNSSDWFVRIVTSMNYRLGYFLFFISGFYTAGNLRIKRKFSSVFSFFLSIASFIVFLLDIFQISIKWQFLYLGNIYFGFFFLFQSSTYFLRIFKIESRSLKFFASIAFLILVGTLLVSENITVLSDFPQYLPVQYKIFFLVGSFSGIRYIGVRDF